MPRRPIHNMDGKHVVSSQRAQLALLTEKDMQTVIVPSPAATSSTYMHLAKQLHGPDSQFESHQLLLVDGALLRVQIVILITRLA